MITSGNTYIKNIYYNGEAIKMVFSCDNYVMYNNKWKATYTGGIVRTAACDATSAISENEITLANLEAVEIGDCVTSIGENAFQNCISLTSIDIPSGVTSIGTEAFRGSSSLSSITISDTVTSIGNRAFQGCDVLSTVTIGSGITSIGMGGFAFNVNLASITINATTPPTLGSGAFYDSTCPIYVPCDSVNAYKAAEDWEDYRTRIQAISGTCFDGKWKATYTGGTTASAECDSTSAITGYEITITPADLASVKIGDCVTSIGDGAFNGCSSLTSINIPDSVTSINAYTFEDCSGLTSCTIGSGVTSIGDTAFQNCSGLTSINLPSSITNIEHAAFYGCRSLNSITVNAVVPPSGVNNFTFSFTNHCPIYVPASSLSAYQSAWSDYASRIQAIQ